MISYRLLTILFLGTYLIVGAQKPGQTETDFAQKARQLLLEAVAAGECAGIAAGFSVDGSIKWQSAAGYHNLKARQAFAAATPTRIASITKPMTAIAVMQLYEAGKIDLDEPIRTYLPDFPDKKEGTITVRHLLNHSSGMGAYASGKERENQKDYIGLQEALQIFQDRELLAAPGREFNYTTYGYVVLGRLIEQVSGNSYEAYMQTNIWDPAGMTHTGIEYADRTVPGQAALYHQKKKGKIKAVTPTNLSDRIPGGGVYSNVTDLLRFGEAVLNNTLVKASTLKMMLTDSGLKQEGNGYGLGWYLYGKNPKYDEVFGHNGAQTGASAFLMLLPEQQTAIAVLSNTSGAMQKVSDIAIQLFEAAAASRAKE